MICELRKLVPATAAVNGPARKGSHPQAVAARARQDFHARRRRHARLTPMGDYANRTFDEIDVGARESITRAMTAVEIEGLALVAGDVDRFHLEGGGARRRPRSAGCRGRGTCFRICCCAACRVRALRSSRRICITPAPSPSAIR